MFGTTIFGDSVSGLGFVPPKLPGGNSAYKRRHPPRLCPPGTVKDPRSGRCVPDILRGYGNPDGLGSSCGCGGFFRGFGDTAPGPVAVSLQVEVLAGIPTVINKAQVHAAIDSMGFSEGAENVLTVVPPTPGGRTIGAELAAAPTSVVLIKSAAAGTMLTLAVSGQDLVDLTTKSLWVLFEAPPGSPLVLDAMRILGTMSAIPKGIETAAVGVGGWIVPVSIVGGVLGGLAVMAWRKKK